MTEWREVRLGQVCELKRGYDLPKSMRSEGTVPIVSSSGVSDFHSEAKVRAPGVVTGRYGTLGAVFYLTEDFWPLNTSLYVRDFKGNNPRFIAAVLESMHLEQYDGAAAVPGLNRNQLHELTVRVPGRRTQDVIAEIVDAVDSFIQNSRRRVEVLENIARAIYREWFVNFRYPGHESAALVDTSLGPVPKGWEAKRLDEITTQLPVGKRYDSKTSSPVGAVPILDQSQTGVMGFHDEVPGVPVSLRAPVFTFANHTCAMRLLYAPFSVIQNVFPKVGKGGVATTLFAYHAGRDKQGIEDYKGHHPRWRETQVVVPPLRLQEYFTVAASPLHQMQARLSWQNTLLEEVRGQLLPRLVTGQIDVSSLNLDGLAESSVA